MDDFKRVILCYCIAFIGLFIGILSIFILGDNNPVEEISEEPKEEIGIDIDLSPNSKENNSEA